MTKIRNHGWREAVQVLRQFGFTYEGTEGDHDSYTKPSLFRPVIVPRWPSLPEFIIKNILKTSGISRKEYARALSPGKKKVSRRAAQAASSEPDQAN